MCCAEYRTHRLHFLVCTHFMHRSVMEKPRDVRVNRALYGVNVSIALDYAAPVLEKCNVRAADA